MDTRATGPLPIVLCFGLWACGTGELGGGELSIDDVAPPPGVAAEPYQHGLTARNASTSVRWSLPDRAPTLDWLAVDPISGLLQGTPRTVVTDPAPFRVRAVDGTRTAERVFVLTVSCRDGARLDCAVPSADTCHAGVAVCQGGQLGACADLGRPGDDRAHCGTGCTEACDDLLTNRCDGACVCGNTGTGCQPGTQCCGDSPAGACADTQIDAHHCGSCRTDCADTVGARAHVALACAAGVCGYPCVAPFGDCDAVPANGCETDTGSSLAHCGGCGRACTAAPGQQSVLATCAAGACLHPCTTGWQNCSAGAPSTGLGEDADGCETVLGTLANCLGCGDVCQTPDAHGSATCGVAGCGVACESGYDACSGQCVDLQSDHAHCGTCNIACNPASICLDGRCCRDIDC